MERRWIDGGGASIGVDEGFDHPRRYELVQRRATDVEPFCYWWLVDLDDEVDGGWWVAMMRLFG